MSDTPFPLPDRAPVTRIRGRAVADVRASGGVRTQPMAGFEPQWRDIVHYIVGITEEIWTDAAVDRIRATYAPDCVIHTSMGTTRGVDGVIAGTIQSLFAFTDFMTEHVAVAWDGDSHDFYTSHLGFAQSVNTGDTAWGPATGARIARHFVADCISRDNLIHTEWLARDNGVALAQMGLEPLAVARRLAELPAPEPLLPLARDAGGLPEPGDPATLRGFVDTMFAGWNARAFAAVAGRYLADAVAHWPGGRTAAGPRAIVQEPIGLLASLPDALVRVEHVCRADETDGTIVAVRWRLDGTSSPYGALGPLPAGRAIALIGMSHWRFRNGLIVEEWTMFDELAALVQALRA